MKIKIVRNTNDPYGQLVWYANRIGEVFEVYSEREGHTNVWITGVVEHPIGYVKDDDCVILNEEPCEKHTEQSEV